MTGLAHAKAGRMGKPRVTAATASRKITLFLCGDVMTGRGIDQVLAHSCDPRLYEPVARDARVYVRLAESAGAFTIERPVENTYIWGTQPAQ